MTLPEEDVIFCLGKLRSEANQLKEHSTEVESCHMDVRIWPTRVRNDSIETGVMKGD